MRIMGLEGTSCRKLSQLMADHVFSNVHRHKVLSVVNGKVKSHEIGRDRRASRPGLDRFAITSFLRLRHFLHEAGVYEITFFSGTCHDLIIILPFCHCGGRGFASSMVLISFWWGSPLTVAPKGTWGDRPRTSGPRRLPWGGQPGSLQLREHADDDLSSGFCRLFRSLPFGGWSCLPHQSSLDKIPLRDEFHRLAFSRKPAHCPKTTSQYKVS